MVYREDIAMLSDMKKMFEVDDLDGILKEVHLFYLILF